MAEKFKRCSNCHVYYVNSGPLQADSSPTIWSHGTNLWTLEWTRDPPPGAPSQLLWAGIENTGQSVTHSVLTPALRVLKTHFGANLGWEIYVGDNVQLRIFVFALFHLWFIQAILTTRNSCQKDQPVQCVQFALGRAELDKISPERSGMVLQGTILCYIQYDKALFLCRIPFSSSSSRTFRFHWTWA